MSIKCMTRVWDYSQNKGSALLLLLAIADFASDDGTNAYPKMETLAEKTRMTERNVQLLLRKLEDSGELLVDINAGPNGTNLYTVNVWPPDRGEKFSPTPPENFSGGEEDFTPGGEEDFTPGVKRISPQGRRGFHPRGEEDFTRSIKEPSRNQAAARTQASISEKQPKAAAAAAGTSQGDAALAAFVREYEYIWGMTLNAFDRDRVIEWTDRVSVEGWRYSLTEARNYGKSGHWRYLEKILRRVEQEGLPPEEETEEESDILFVPAWVYDD